MSSGRDVAAPSASGGQHHEASAGRRLGRILVATDDSVGSQHAVRFAVELAAEDQSEVLFVHVIPTAAVVTTAGSDEVRDPISATAREHAETQLESALAIARARGVAARSAVLVGPAAAEIVAYAEHQDVNMIVVGSRLVANVASPLLGRVALDVLRATPRPLLITDGERSITYCGNDPCRDVRMYGQYTLGESRLPEEAAHSPGRARVRHVRSGSAKPSARAVFERVGSPVPSRSTSASSSLRLETIVRIAVDTWAVTATIPYDGVILLAEFGTRDSAREWFAIGDTLVQS